MYPHNLPLLPAKQPQTQVEACLGFLAEHEAAVLSLTDCGPSDNGGPRDVATLSLIIPLIHAAAAKSPPWVYKPEVLLALLNHALSFLEPCFVPLQHQAPVLEKASGAFLSEPFYVQLSSALVGLLAALPQAGFELLEEDFFFNLVRTHPDADAITHDHT